LVGHPAFLGPYSALFHDVEDLFREDELAHQEHPKAKLLARINKLVLEEIPRDPNAPEFKLGNTISKDHKHWKRAKFLGRFRLFFRFSSSSRIIIYAWVNDENTLRKAGSHADVYSVFQKRLKSGDPPDSWDDLLREAKPLQDHTPNVKLLDSSVYIPHKRRNK
jgi:toxin YhaV